MKVWRKDAGPALADVAGRLLPMHFTTAASEHNRSLLGNPFTKARNHLSKERAEMLIYVRQNSTQRSAALMTRRRLEEEIDE